MSYFGALLDPPAALSGLRSGCRSLGSTRAAVERFDEQGRPNQVIAALLNCDYGSGARRWGRFLTAFETRSHAVRSFIMVAGLILQISPRRHHPSSASPALPTKAGSLDVGIRDRPGNRGLSSLCGQFTPLSTSFCDRRPQT